MRVLGLFLLCLLALPCFSQEHVEGLVEECTSHLERCDQKLQHYHEQLKRFEAYKAACDEEIALRDDARGFAEEAIDTCKLTVEIREAQLDRLKKIETNLDDNLNQCIEGYGDAMRDYKSCVETSSFSLSKSKVFWVGLVLGLLIGVPIAI